MVFYYPEGAFLCDMEGWIKLYRKFSEWEWFNVSEMVHLFIYLLLNANREDGTWRGVEIKRGQILTGLESLHKVTGISIRTIRTCLDRLQTTREIDRQTTNKYSIITICNYESYQGEKLNSDKQNDRQNDNQLTSNRQAGGIKQEYKKIRNKELKDTPLIPSIGINYQFIVDNYHSLCPGMSKVIAINEKRKGYMNARIKEYGIEKVIQVLKMAGESDWLNGKNDRNWKADFEWIIKPENFLKILEGRYQKKKIRLAV